MRNDPACSWKSIRSRTEQEHLVEMKKSKKTKKIITDEMVKKLTVQQLYDLRMQGWEYETPVKDWRELMPKMDKADDRKSTYFGSVGLKRETSPEENDPELQELANRMGLRPKDLNLFRELMLERYGDRYSEENYPPPDGSEE
jgi:hypothetical protein